MKKWIFYLLGVITGIFLTYVYTCDAGRSNNSNVSGLELFEVPGEYMEYSQLEVIQVIDSGYALAVSNESIGVAFLIIPNENQRFYDNQKITIKKNQRIQHVGTYRYINKQEIVKTVPAVKIIDDAVVLPKSTATTVKNKKDMDKTLFDKPGECVSRKNLEVQKVLESGDAIAMEIREEIQGYILTSDLEVLILAQEGSNFYDKQIIKVPEGKCAIQIGNYKYKQYGATKVIPIIAIR